MPTLRKPRQAVLGKGLPDRRIGNELPHRGADARIVVECSHANADRFRVARVRAEDRGSASSAKPLLAAGFRPPDAQRLLPADDLERSGSGVRLCGCRSTASPLTPLAVAVAGPDKRRRDFISNCTAVTSTGERELHAVTISHRVTCGRRAADGPPGYFDGQGDLQVNGQFVDWGAYSAGHAYTLALPLSGTVNLAVFNGYATGVKEPGWYADNVGALGARCGSGEPNGRAAKAPPFRVHVYWRFSFGPIAINSRDQSPRREIGGGRARLGFQSRFDLGDGRTDPGAHPVLVPPLARRRFVRLDFEQHRPLSGLVAGRAAARGGLRVTCVRASHRRLSLA